MRARKSFRARTGDTSFQYLQLRLRLLQPEPHVHLAVHRRRDGEVLVRVLTLARAPVELTEAEVAVGDKGAHAELLGQIEGLAIKALRSVEVWRRAACGGLGEDSQDSCFSAPTADATAVVERVPSGSGRVAFTAAQEIHMGEHLLRPNHDAWPPGTLALVMALLEERQALLDTAA